MRSIFLLLGLFLVLQCQGYTPWSWQANQLKVNRTKFGMLIGYQQGKYTTLELGMEGQWKQVKLKKPITVAGAFTYEYQLKANVQGFKLGAWAKFGRMDFTYGLNGLAFTNNEDWRVGFAPALGFKLIGFHFITSYNFAFGPSEFDEYQKMHLSIRYFLSRSRQLHVKRNNKKDGNKDKNKS